MSEGLRHCYICGGEMEVKEHDGYYKPHCQVCDYETWPSFGEKEHAIGYWNTIAEYHEEYISREKLKRCPKCGKRGKVKFICGRGFKVYCSECTYATPFCLKPEEVVSCWNKGGKRDGGD